MSTVPPAVKAFPPDRGTLRDAQTCADLAKTFERRTCILTSTSIQWPREERLRIFSEQSKKWGPFLGAKRERGGVCQVRPGPQQ